MQAALIDRALGLVRPGGRLVFCTCSLLPEEGEAQLAAALARHPGLVVERADGAGVEPGVDRTEPGRCGCGPDYWAERGGMDGFFIAWLRAPRRGPFCGDSPPGAGLWWPLADPEAGADGGWQR